MNENKMLMSVCDRLENIVGKGENASDQHFLISHSISNTLPVRAFKVWIMWCRVKVPSQLAFVTSEGQEETAQSNM